MNAGVLRKLLAEPHHLGFRVSGKGGQYDNDVVLIKLDWYDRLIALAAAPIPEGDAERLAAALAEVGDPSQYETVVQYANAIVRALWRLAGRSDQ